MQKIQILLYEAAKKSFLTDLKNNGIPYNTLGLHIIVDNTPKTRTAIQLVKERFGSRSIITKFFETENRTRTTFTISSK
jgi:hypothetical protein